MAEVDSGGGKDHGKKGGPKQKKKSTKIDMTAMVDVAFLLLTFFILTTTMNTPKAMELNVPPKADELPEDEQKADVVEDKVLTLLLGENDQVHYYIGITDPEVKSVDYSDEGIRKVIMQHVWRKGIPHCKGEQKKGCWDPIIVIKPNETSRYKNLVDILDEMSITGSPKYALTEMTEVDSTLLVANLLK